MGGTDKGGRGGGNRGGVWAQGVPDEHEAQVLQSREVTEEGQRRGQAAGEWVCPA